MHVVSSIVEQGYPALVNAKRTCGACWLSMLSCRAETTSNCPQGIREYLRDRTLGCLSDKLLMRKLFKNGGLLRRDKVEAEAATTTKGTLAAAAAAAVDPTPLAQKPDLYSTEGSIGMKVVAEPSDAVLE